MPALTSARQMPLVLRSVLSSGLVALSFSCRDWLRPLTSVVFCSKLDPMCAEPAVFAPLVYSVQAKDVRNGLQLLNTMERCSFFLPSCATMAGPRALMLWFERVFSEHDHHQHC
jgi:hypothetical protein